MASNHPILRLSDRTEGKLKFRKPKSRGTRYCNLGNLRVITGSPQFEKPEEKNQAVEIPKANSPQLSKSEVKVIEEPDPKIEILSNSKNDAPPYISRNSGGRRRRRRRRYKEQEQILNSKVEVIEEPDPKIEIPSKSKNDASPYFSPNPGGRKRRRRRYNAQELKTQCADSESKQTLHYKDYAFRGKVDLKSVYPRSKYKWYNSRYKYSYHPKYSTDNYDDVSDAPLEEEDLEEVEVASESDDHRKTDILVGFRKYKPSYLKHRILGHFKPKIFMFNQERTFIKCAGVDEPETEVLEVSEVEDIVSEVEYEEILGDGNLSDEFLNENMVIIDDAEEELENINSEPIHSEPSNKQLIEEDAALPIKCSESQIVSSLHQDKAIFQDSLNAWDGHLIGLEYIVEIWNQPGGKVVNYHCILCDNSISLPEPFNSNECLAAHVDTINHMSLYLAKHFPSCGYKLTGGTPNVGSDDLRNCIKELESKFARESIFITNHDYFQSNLKDVKRILDDSSHWSEEDFMLDLKIVVPVQKSDENQDGLKTTNEKDSSSPVDNEAKETKHDVPAAEKTKCDVPAFEETKCDDPTAESTKCDVPTAVENMCIVSEHVELSESTRSVVDKMVNIVSNEVESLKQDECSLKISDNVQKKVTKRAVTKFSSLHVLRKHSKLTPNRFMSCKKLGSKGQSVKVVKQLAVSKKQKIESLQTLPEAKSNLSVSSQASNTLDTTKKSDRNVVSDEVVLPSDVKPHMKLELKDRNRLRFMQRSSLTHSKYCFKRLYHKTNSKAGDVVHDQVDSEVTAVVVPKLTSSTKEHKESATLVKNSEKNKTSENNDVGAFDSTKIVLKKTLDKKNVAHPHKHSIKEHSKYHKVVHHPKIAFGKIKQSPVLDVGVHKSTSKKLLGSSDNQQIVDLSPIASVTKQSRSVKEHSRSPQKYHTDSPNSRHVVRSYRKISRSPPPHSGSSSHNLSKSPKRKVVPKHDEYSRITEKLSGRIIASPLPGSNSRSVRSAPFRDAGSSMEQAHASRQSRSPKKVFLESGGSSKGHEELQNAPELWFERFSGKHVNPWKRNSKSPYRQHSRSPIDKYSEKYKKYSKSPIKRFSKSPVRKYSRSPPRKYFKSPNRRYTKSPIRRYSRSPVKGHSRSPVRRHSRSPVRRHSRSPVRRHSRSPVRRHSRSPVRGHSRSPVRRYPRSLLKGMSRSPSKKYARSPNRRHSRSPYRWTSRSPVRRHSKSPFRRYSRSPIDSTSISSVDKHTRTSIRRRVRSPVSSYSRSSGRNLSRSPSRNYSRSPEKRLLENRNRINSRSPARLLEEKYSRKLSHRLKSSDDRHVSYSKLSRHVKRKDDFPVDDLDSISDEDESFYFSSKDKISGTTEFRKLPYASKMLIVSILQGLSVDDLDPNDPAVQRMVQFFNSNKSELQQFINQNAPGSNPSDVHTQQMHSNRDFQHQQIPSNLGRSFSTQPSDVNFAQSLCNAPPSTLPQDFSFPINFPPPQKGSASFSTPVQQRFPFPVENQQPWPPSHGMPPMQHPMQAAQNQMLPHQLQPVSPNQFQIPPNQFQMPPPQTQVSPNLMLGGKHQLPQMQPNREELAARQQQMAQDQLNSFFHAGTSRSTKSSIPTDVVFKDLRATVCKLFGDKKSSDKKETSSITDNLNTEMNQSRHSAKSPTDFDYRAIKSTNVDSADSLSDQMRLREGKNLSFPPPDAKVSFCDTPRFAQRNLFPVVNEPKSMKGNFLVRQSSSDGVSDTKISLAQRLASVLIKVGMVDVPGQLLQEMLMKIGAYSSCPPQDIHETDIIYILRKCGYMR